VAELECRNCGAMTSYSLELVWRLDPSLQRMPACAALERRDLEAFRERLSDATNRVDDPLEPRHMTEH